MVAKKPSYRSAVLLACNSGSSDKLAPLFIGKYQNAHCFKTIKTKPTKYVSGSEV
jgi:hypothetical protein